MANASQFIGSKISLISKSEIRYEGILYSLDVLEATISLAKVKSFGTEDRPTERPVPPKDEIYEFIIFRGSDIKGIDVVEPPQAPAASKDGFPNDPAIVEVSHYHSSSRSSSGFGGNAGPSSSNNFGGSGFGSSAAAAAKPSVFDLFSAGRSNNSTPAFGMRKSPTVDTGTQSSGRRDRGASQQQRYNGNAGRGRGNMSRGAGRSNSNNYQPRGRGSYDNRNYRGGNQYQRGGQREYPNRDYHRGPPRTQGILQAPAQAKVTFDAPFDFEKANEELLTAIKDLKITDEKNIKKENNENAEADEPRPDASSDDGESKEKEPTTYYKKDNFFDSISCEALEKNRQGRPDWRAERKLNAETFGLTNQQNNRRGGGYYNRNYGRGGGYGYGYNNRGNYRGGRGGYGGYNNSRRGNAVSGGGGNRGSF